MQTTHVDVLVIGAGQAGLAMGYHIQQLGHPVRFLLVDRHARIGDTWRKRYDSLVLFTPRRYSALPGLPVPGEPEGFPTKDEIADYLEDYADHFRLPVRLNTSVLSLEKQGKEYSALLSDGSCINAQAVVLSTGAFQKPAVPQFAELLPEDVKQLNSANYRSPADVSGNRVLVVGDGATGRQFAKEIAETGRHQVILATGFPRRVLPERILGRSFFWWADHLGLLDSPFDSDRGKFLARGDDFPGKQLDLRALRQAGVEVLGRMMEISEGSFHFKNWSDPVYFDTVIWATGYESDDSWVAIPQAKNNRGNIVHYRGVTPSAGLFLLGRSWQWTRASALLHGVGNDAAFLARVMRYYLRDQPLAITA